MDFSAENGWRERLMRWLVQILHGLYRCANYRQATAWDVTLEDLQQLPAAQARGGHWQHSYSSTVLR